MCIRDRFAAGTAPGEARASVAGAFSLPRVTAMAEKRPRYGVPPAGAFDLRPGSGGASWGFARNEDHGRVIRILGSQR
eukprot:2131361-Alexandrium_andersonii.AAC.1